MNASINKRGAMGHDAINQWIVTPIRAGILGIDPTPCSACAGKGRLAVSPERLSLAVWAGVPGEEIYVMLQVNDLEPDDLPRVRALLAEHHARLRERLASVAESRPLPTGALSLKPKSDSERGWNSDWEAPTWSSWASEMADSDIDLNLVVDLAFLPCEPDADPARIPSGPMAVRLAHPRKGAVATVLVRLATEADRASMAAFLQRSLEAHARHFAWALAPGNGE